MNITLTGQVGKSFDETPREIAEVASSARLTYSSLSADLLAFTLSPEFLNSSDQAIPEEAQEITLHFDGQRQFIGHVGKVSTRGSADDFTLDVEVMGPWFFMENTALSDTIEGGIERPQFRFPKGDLRASIIRYLERAMALGVPLQVGEIDPCYDVPTITLRDGSLAFGLSELIQQVPDAIGWMDYRGEGLPRFNLTRRKTGADQTTIPLEEVTTHSIEGQFNLVVRKVSIPYAESTPDGADVLLTQESETGPMGGLQIIPLSGPELLDYEPPEVTVQEEPLPPITTIPLLTGRTIRASDFAQIWPFFQRLRNRNPGFLLSNSQVLRWFPNPTGPAPGLVDRRPRLPSYNGSVPALRALDGTPLNSSEDPHYVSHDPFLELPSSLGTATPLKRGLIDGTFVVFLPAPGSTVFGPNPITPARRMVENELEAQASHRSTRIGGENNGETHFFFEVSFEVLLFDAEYEDQVFIPRPPIRSTDYQYEEPPPGYAENLRAAQSWLPHTGDLALQAPFAPVRRYSGDTLNLSGGLPKWANMGALVEGEEFDLHTGEHTLRLGLPSRFSGVTSATRIDRRPNDNIFAI